MYGHGHGHAYGKLIACLMVAGCLWLLTGAAQAQLFSPGPLSKAHASLEGDDKCQRCHASGSQVVETRCTECHADIGAERRSFSGLHGKAFKGKPCSQCHVEHVGKDVSLIRWPGTDPKRFDHDQTGFALRDAHAQTKCAECHDKKNTRGVATYLGLEKNCASCHKEPHQGRFGERCTDCHDAKAWDHLSLTGFDHDLARFHLDGAHEKVECAGCHGKPAQFKNLEFADCKSCHEDPHQGRFLTACKSCHDDDAWNRIVMPRSMHPGLSLAAGHAKTECRSCHDAGLLKEPSKGNTCVGCHAPVHEAPFGEKCEQCHESIRWTELPVNIGRTAHARTKFPLRGEHARAACEGCHLPSMPRAARYRSLEYDQCADCHKDPHKGTLSDQGDCARCHDLLGFSPSLVTPEVHAKFGFALEGGHSAAACSSCHEDTGHPRTVWQNEQDQCADCHKNPHGNQFAVEMSSGGCAHCHAPAGWGLPNIDHSFWPLTGAHASAPCTGCHTANPEDRKAGKGASYKGAPRDCAGCHDDEHAGQFRASEPVRGCEFCHSTSKFALPYFDHTKLTGYELVGKHRETKCASCHPSVHLRNGEDVPRYRLGYNQCADCHADPHTQPEAPR